MLAVRRQEIDQNATHFDRGSIIPTRNGSH